MRRPSNSLYGAAALLYGFIYAPIAVVIVFSFNAARHGLRWEGFTLQWYEALWQNEAAWNAAKNTLALALGSTVIATVLGTMLGFALSRYRLPMRRFISQMLYLPVFVPDIVMAVALLLMYRLVRDWTGLFQLGLPTMIVAHVTFQIPFVAIVVRSRMAGLDPALEEAARDLGASGGQTFRAVTLPLMMPGVVAGAMLAFTLSLDDFVVSFFTSGPGSMTLPILIYTSVKRGITPEVHALSTLILAASVVGALSVTLLQRRDRA